MKTKLVALCAFILTMAVAAFVNAAEVVAAAPAVVPDASPLIDPVKLGVWVAFISLGVNVITQLLRMPAFGEWVKKMGPIWKRVLVVLMATTAAVGTGLVEGVSQAEMLTLIKDAILGSVGMYELAVRPVMAHGKRAKEKSALAPNPPDLNPS